MNKLEKQFRRLERAFAKTLDNCDRDPQEYEDDVWNFFYNCWHLKDWIRNDGESVPQTVSNRVDQDVESFWKLVLIGDLVNRSRHLRLSPKESDEDVRQRELRIVNPGVKTEWIDGRQQTIDIAGQNALLVVDKLGLEYPVRDLAKDAMRIWHTLLKAYGLNHLL